MQLQNASIKNRIEKEICIVTICTGLIDWKCDEIENGEKGFYMWGKNKVCNLQMNRRLRKFCGLFRF